MSCFLKVSQRENGRRSNLYLLKTKFLENVRVAIEVRCLFCSQLEAIRTNSVKGIK